METLKGYLTWSHDKLGDGIVATMDEVSFWGGVIAVYMEWDEGSAQRYAEKQREEIRDQLREANEAIEEVKVHLEEKEREEAATFEAEQAELEN